MRAALLTAWALTCALAPALSGAVTVSLPLNPASPYAGQTVQLSATGLAGVASNVNVTVTPPAGNGNAVTFAATTVTPNASTTTATTARKVIFIMPASLTTAAAISGASISISGTASGTSFTSNTASPFTISPPPLISNVSPGAGQVGTTVSLNVRLANTSWAQPASPGQITLIFFGPNSSTFTAPATAFNAATQMVSSSVAIPANAAVGAYTVCALPSGTPGTSCPAGDPFQSPGFFVASSAQQAISLISPNVATACATNVPVTLTLGFNPTTLNFGDGIGILSFTGAPVAGTSNYNATTMISVDCLASPGPRTVTAVSAGQFAIAAGGFTVGSNGASISSAAPSAGVQGTNISVTLTGVGTHWTQSGTQVSFGSGINVGNVTVNQAAQTLVASISIAPNAALGNYSATATTNGEVAIGANVFSVTVSGAPKLLSVTPTNGAQGASPTVTVTTSGTSFTAHPPTFDFGSNITPSNVNVISDTQATVSAAIGYYAFTGSRTVTLSSNGANLQFSFNVLPDSAVITSIDQTSLLAGKSYHLHVLGAGTHWVQGLTTASFGPSLVTLISIVSSTEAYVDITIPATASGVSGVSMTTGGEVANYTLPGGAGISINGCVPSLSLSPSTGMIGTPLLQVGFQTDCVAFANPGGGQQTVASIDGQGVTISNPSFPTGQTSGSAYFSISSTAPSSPTNICPNRTVTLTVPGNPATILTAPFCVTSTPAVLTSISPWHGSQNAVLTNVAITGQYTHFASGTTVTAGPVAPGGVTVSNVNVIDSTHLTATFSIGSSAPFGWRTVYVNTGSEQLQIGFYVDPPVPPVSPSLISVVPSSIAQGQGPVPVYLTGNFTHFNSSTLLILGQGVTVSNVTITDATHIQAYATADPLTPVGGRAVETITLLTAGGVTPPVYEDTSQNVAVPIFSVTAGAAYITSPSHSSRLTVNQGQVVNFSLTGNNVADFVQGATTVNFGSGITVASLTVDSPTTLHGQISVSYSAATGYRGFTVTTLGQTALSDSDAILVNLTEPSGATITPTTAMQGTELNVQVQGIGTNWVNGLTAASFGNSNGLKVKSFTVNNATQQAVIDLVVAGTTYITVPYIVPGPLPYTLTITTQQGSSLEQETLTNVFSVGPGAAIITNVTPTSGRQGSTENVTITGQNTNFQNGVTQALMTSGACPPYWSPYVDVNVANVMVTSATSAMLSVAVSSTAPTGLRNLCVFTLGESASYANAFQVLPGTPTLNGVSPVSGQQGQTGLQLSIIGQFTHWVQGATTATFGNGVTAASSPIYPAITTDPVTGNQTATVTVNIDPLSYVGPRTVTLTTGTEIVSGQLFSITKGPAEITTISPSMGNQGQQNLLIQVNGLDTHWAQGATGFQLTGDGITVNGFQVQSAVSAIADISISPTASLGARSVYISTSGETLTDAGAFLVTGGIPAITCVQPNTVRQGAQNVNINVCGAYTTWVTGATHINIDSDVAVQPATAVNSNTSITLVANVSSSAALGLHTLTIQTGSQVLTAYVNVIGSSTGTAPPPSPYISYMYPSSALQGQVLDVYFTGRYTNWLPGTTTIAFGAGITVESFQVTSTTSAVATISIDPNAAMGGRTVTISTAPTESETATFTVTVGVPAITLIDPGSIYQGQSRDFDLVGQFTAWTIDGTTFAACPGVTVGNIRVFGPTAARITMSASPTAPPGGCELTSTTTRGSFTQTAGGSFSIVPGTAVITSVSPNTALQGTTLNNVAVTGFSTNWVNGTTTFSFGSGITVSNVNVTSATTATMTLTMAPLASVGEYAATAQTGGEIATLHNAFVVQPGTPILLSSIPTSEQQGSMFSIGILGQFTSFDQATTTVNLGAGIVNPVVNVTSSNSITVTGSVSPVTPVGYRNIVVTQGTGSSLRALTLYSALYISPGPAAISSVSPASQNQGVTAVPVTITGANTHFTAGTPSIGFSGSGVTAVLDHVIDDTHLVADLTVSSVAMPGQYNVSVTTLGESAAGSNVFTVVASSPVLSFVNPASAIQGQTLNVLITGTFTSFTNTSMVSFGSGITVNNIVTNPTPANDSTHLTVSITISPTAALGTRVVTVDSVSSNNPNSPGVGFSVSPAVGTFNEYLYVPNRTGGTISGYSVNSSTGGLNSVFMPIGTASDEFVAATPSGRYVYTSSEAGSISGYAVNPANGALTAVPGSPYTAVDPKGLAISPSGLFLYAANNTANTVSAYSINPATGALTPVTGSPFSSGAGANLITVSPSGRFVYSTNVTGNSVSGFTVNTATGALIPISGSPFAAGRYADGVRVTHDERFLYATNIGDNTVSGYSIDPVSGALTPIAGSPWTTGTTAGLIALSLDDRFAYVANTGSNNVSGYTVNSATGALAAISGSPFAADSGAVSVAVDPAGKYVWVTNYQAQDISAYTIDVIAGGLTPAGSTATSGNPYESAVITLAPRLLPLAPGSANQGTSNLSVWINGLSTHFDNTTTVQFGAGITASLQVVSATQILATVNIPVNAPTGAASLTVTTGGEVVTLAGALTVIAPPSLTLVTPGSAAQAATSILVSLTGLNTHFQSGNTTASFGAGITPGTVSVTDSTHASVMLSVAPTASIGPRSVSLITTLSGGGAETATWGSSFNVTAGPAAITQLSPASGYQNQNALVVAITGTATHFDNTSTVTFGSGITVSTVQQVSATSINATISIDPAAAVGTRTVTVTTGGETASIANGFTVNAGIPVITTVAPNTAHQNDTLNVQLTGIYTTFQQGVTTATFGAGITVNGVVSVTDATHATANITLSPTATLGARTVTVTTGAQAATFSSGFTVLAGLPQITMLTPAAGSQGTTQTVIVNGLYTNFAQGVSTVSIAGGGLTVGTVTVNGPTTLSVPVTIANTAGLGARQVTVTTGAETASSATVLFTIQQGTNIITSISPNSAATASSATTFNVSLAGQNTAWVQGTTTASFGPGIQVGGAAAGAFGPVTVNSANSLTASLTLPGNTAVGPRNVSVQTGSQVQSVTNGFTVLPSFDNNPPTVITTSPASGATSVSLNTAISFEFSKPVNASTLLTNATNMSNPTSTDVFLYDSTIGQYIGGAISLDASGRIATFVPGQLLAVNRQYTFTVNGSTTPGVRDTVTPNANHLTNYSFNFTTGYATNTTGPTLISSNIYNGDTGIGLNAPVNLKFSAPVNPVTQPNGIIVQTGTPGVAVNGTYSFSAGNTIVTFTPTGNWSASTTYTVLYTGVLTDSSGNPLTNPGSLTFTTGTASDPGPGPSAVSWNPGTSETNVGINVTPSFRFSKPVNPVSVNSGNFLIVNNNTGIAVPSTIAFSADRMTGTLTPASPLATFTQYYFQVYSYSDLAGNTGTTQTVYFTTGGAADSSVPSISLVSPSNNATSVPVNARVAAVSSGPLDATSVTNASIVLTPTSPAGAAVPGAVSLASDQVTLAFMPSTALGVSTTYSIQISGLRGVDGSTITPFSSSFSTGSSSAPVTSAPAVTSYLPASGSVQPPTTTITLNINRPMNPGSFSTNNQSYSTNSFSVLSSVNGTQTVVTGSVAVTNTATTSAVVFTPFNPLPPGASVSVYASYWVCAYDFAQNCLSTNNWTFSIMGGTDTTPPTITSITPSGGATGVGQSTPVVITFSKPINPNTINSQTFGVFSGDSLLSSSISRSADNRTVTLTQTLPSASPINVAVTHGVTDLLGNALADYTSQFTTAATPPATHPNVVTLRPGNGATGVSTTSPVVLVTDTPLNPTTVPGALHISSNGVLVAGSLQFSSNGQTITFTPGGSFAAGALVQVFFDTTATDNSGNTLNSYSASFTVQSSQSSVSPTVTSLSPTNGATISYSNPVVDIQFTKPIAAASVTAANFFLKRNDTGSAIPATVSQPSPYVVRIVPNAALDPTGGPYYRINISSSVKDTDGNSYTGPTASYLFYLNSVAAPVTTAPTVTFLAPPNGSTNVGDNALFRIQFSKPIDPLSVNQNTILISGGAYSVLPLSIAFDSPNQTVTITPQSPLPDNASMSIAINGVVDPSGNAVIPVTANFTTAPGPDVVRPTVIQSSVDSGVTNVPVNSTFTFVFSEPMDTRLLNSSNFYIYDTYLGTNIPANISFSADGTSGTLVPQSALPVGRSITIYIQNGQDVTGNTMVSYSVNFTTSFSTNTVPPSITLVSPAGGATGVPTNTQVQIQFSESLQNTSLSQVTLTGSTLTTTASLSSGDHVLSLTPNTLLLPNTTYTITVTRVKDTSGNVFSGTVTSTFTTGSGVDLTAAPNLSSTNPASSGTGVGTNASFTVRFSKPINPIQLTNYRLYNNSTSATIPVTPSFSADRMTVTFTPAAALSIFTQYGFYLPYAYDLAGNRGACCGSTGYGNYSFTTGGGTDNSIPSVSAVSPNNGNTGVPINAKVQVVLTQPIDQTSVNNSSVTLTPTSPAGAQIAGVVSLASDQVTMTFTPSANLSPSTVYSIQVSGFKGVSGNVVTPFTSTFATNSTSTPTTTSPSVSSYLPASGSTQPATATITLNVNRPMNPVAISTNNQSYTSNSLSVFTSYNGATTVVTGTVAVTNTATASTIVFTPSSPFTPGATVNVYASYWVCMYDFAGNCMSNNTWSFTIAAGTDTTPPTVTSVTPASGASGAGQNTPVVITFSKPLNPNTINGQTFTLFNGDTQISPSISRSGDGRTVTLTETLPAAALISVVVTHGVTDLVGNALTDFQSNFTTAPVPSTTRPNVVTMRPGNGATGVPVNTPITLYTDTPLNSSTVPGALHVSQNGSLVTGNVTMGANNQTIVFTPSSALTPGDLVQVFFDTTATDNNGNALNSYNGSFTLASSLSGVGPTVTAYSPNTTISITNPVVDIQFTKNIAAASVTTANFFLKRNDSTLIAASVSQPAPNVVRISPSAALDPTGGPYYRINISSSVLDTDGKAYTGPTASYNFYLSPTATADTVRPVVSYLAPPNGSSNVGDNAQFRIQFSKPIDPISVTQSTIAVSGGSYSLVPASISFDSPNQTVTITPQSPLPDSTPMTIAIAGVIDPAGNAVMPLTTNFTTAAGADVTQPTVTQSSVDSGATGVPVNSTFSLVFSKPMDTRLLNGTNFGVYDNYLGVWVPVSISFSADWRTGTLNPTSALAVGRNFTIYARNAQDLTGNAMAAFSVGFTTSFSTNTVAPTVITTSPANGATNIPINTQVQIQFSESLQATSLSQVTLTGSTLTTTASLSVGDRVLTLTPNTILQPNTTYTITITGVKDTSGNTLSGTVTATFTTGPGADLTSGPSLVSYNPASGQTGVGTNDSAVFRFSKPINPIQFSNYRFYNTTNSVNVPVSVSFSTDRLTATLTPLAPLATFTQYAFYDYYATDLVGNTSYNYQPFYFTTGGGTDSSVPSVSVISPTNGNTGVPINTRVIAVMSQPIDSTSVNNSAIVVTPTNPAGAAVAGTVSLASDQVTLTFTPTVNLSPSTTYSVQVSGFRGVDGVPATPFTSSFTTNSSSTPLTGAPTITSYLPANLSTQPTTATITLNINRPIDPASVSTNNQSYTSNSLSVLSTYNGVQTVVTGTVAVTNTATAATVVFTPAGPFTPGATINVYPSYWVCIYDFALNCTSSNNWSFSIAAGTDTTPPTVTSVTPSNGATGAGPSTPVVITFSKPLNPNTITSSNFALFNGVTRLSPSINRSADGRTVTLTQTLPASATIAVAVTHGVTDLVGNPLTDFQSTFTTAPTPPSGHPNVITMRPGSGATGVSATSPITLVTDTPLNQSTVAGALHISQNGSLVGGSLSFSGNNQTILFTPTSAFAAGALVQVFFDTTATDNYGNTLNSYNGSLTVSPANASVSPTVSALSPYNGQTISISNPVVDILFTKNIAAASVTTANFFLMRNNTTLITSTVTQVAPNVIRITPTATLDPTGAPYYRINISSSVKDTDGNSYTGPTASYYFYLTTSATPDHLNPVVSSLAPPNGSSNVGDNALIRVLFSKPIDPNSVNQNTIQISGGGYTAVPSSISFDSPNQTVTITPQAPLPDNATLTLAVNGVIDPAGNPVVAVSTQFNTGGGPDTVAPTVTSTSIDGGLGAVPVNSSITVQFSEPMDTTLLNGSNFRIRDGYTGQNIPVNYSYAANWRSATITPQSALPVGRSMTVYVNTAQDLTGNTMTSFSLGFTTAFTSNSAAPTVTMTSPANGAVNVPTNAQIQVLFSEPVQDTSLSGVTLAGGTALTITPSLSSAQVVSLTPNTLFQANTLYTVTIAGVKDTSGNVMTAPVTLTFTTGPGVDLNTSATVTSYSPAAGDTNVGTNASAIVRFSKPVNPIQTGYFQIVNYNGYFAVPATLTYSADRMSATLTPISPLIPYGQYYLRISSFSDLVGNTNSFNYYGYNAAPAYFYTGAGTDSTIPSVSSISPTNSITGVPVNARVVAVMTQPIDPTSVSSSSITLIPTSPSGGSVAGTVSLASDQVTMTFVPAAALSVSTTYSVQVSGFRGVSGNAVTPLTSSFTTGSSSAPLTTTPAVTSYLPASGTTQPATATITLNINRPMNPASFIANLSNGSDSLAVLQTVSGVQTEVTGSIAVTNTSGGSTVVFTPSVPFSPGASVNVYTSYWVCAYDFAQNCMTSTNWSFSITAGTDTTAPTVTSVTPPNGSTGLGLATPVVITFSKPLNPNTISGSTFSLLNGSATLSTSIQRSADNRVITLSASLPVSSVITAAITGGVTDLAGNHLTPYSTQFTTTSNPVTSSFSVNAQRPANGTSGVAVNSPIYLTTNRPVNASTIPGALHVSQNGVIVAGATTVSGNGESILFTPASNFANSASIQVFLDQTATDQNGNPVNYYAGSFTTASAATSTGPTVSVLSPGNGSTIGISNPVVDIQFSSPIAASTVNSTNFFLMRNNTTLIAVTVSQPAPNVVRIVPTSLLDPTNGPYYRINISSSVTDTSGNAYTGPTASYYFYLSSSANPDTNAPALVGAAPAQGSTVGDNALINLTFSKAMDTVSINATTVTVNGGVVPASFSFNSSSNAVITPLAPLPDSALLTITLNGIIDPSGNALPAQSIQFNTTNGADDTAPVVLSSSVDSGLTVPSNTGFTVNFSKPMYAASFNSGNFYFYDNTNNPRYPSVNISFSSDGLTGTIDPVNPLTAGHNYILYVNSGQDLSGNTMSGYSVSFYVGSAADTQPPTVLFTNPGSGETSNPPINTQLQILFNKSVQLGSLSQITLTGGPAIVLRPTLTNGDQTVLLNPNSALAPNTTYTLTIQGVISTAGAVMPAPVVVVFTTGSGAALTGTSVVSTSPAANATGVAASVNPSVTFTSPINAVSAYGNVYLRVSSNNSTVPATLTFSSDYKTAIIVPNAPLASGTQYNIYVGGSNITDQAGNSNATSTTYTFTTQ